MEEGEERRSALLGCCQRMKKGVAVLLVLYDLNKRGEGTLPIWLLLAKKKQLVSLLR